MFEDFRLYQQAHIAQREEGVHMKLKAVVSEHAPSGLIDALGSREFALSVLQNVIRDKLECDDPVGNPGVYCVQQPDLMISVGEAVGVEVSLTGVGIGNRTNKMLHVAIETLFHVVMITVVKEMMKEEEYPPVQVFCTMMLDGAIETAPGLGVRSNILGRGPNWIMTGGDSDSEKTSSGGEHPSTHE